MPTDREAALDLVLSFQAASEELAAVVGRDFEFAITPGGRVGDASSLGRPGRKGPRKTDDYTRMVAHALMRKRGMTKSKAIAIARGAIKRWARGGGHTKPQVRAAAAKSYVNQKRLDHNKRGRG